MHNPTTQSRYTVDMAPEQLTATGEVMVNLTKQATVSGDAIVVATYDSDAITRGMAFTMAKNFSIGSGAVVNVLIDTSTYTPVGNQLGLIYFMPADFQTTAGPVTVVRYEGTNYTGGTVITCYNPNLTATKTSSATTITTGASGVTKGTPMAEYLCGGQSSNQNSAAGAGNGASFNIRSHGQKALIEITNSSGSAITFHYNMIFFEI